MLGLLFGLKEMLKEMLQVLALTILAARIMLHMVAVRLLHKQSIHCSHLPRTSIYYVFSEPHRMRL